MIEARNLTRRFGAFTAVDDVSFSVGEREIVGILGPNGAGKTTTIRMVTGFLPPTTGTVSIRGRSLARESLEARREMGYLPENVALYPEMRVTEYLGYRGWLEGLSRGKTRERMAVALDRCLLTEVADQIIGTLSKGYRQRVGLAMAMLHDPSVLVLDEPTVGLDPKQIVAIRELIRELGRQRTLLLSTHILPEVELLCDRVIIFDGGKIVAQGTPRELQEDWSGKGEIRVTLKDAASTAFEVLGAIEGVAGITHDNAGGNSFVLECGDAVDPREEIFRAAVENGWVLLELRRARASLEDVFVRLTTRETASAAAADDVQEKDA